MENFQTPSTPQEVKSAKRQMHPVALSALNMVAPPLAHRFHTRYENKLHLLFWDTILAISMLILIGINIMLLATKESQNSTLNGSIMIPAEIQSAVPVALTIQVEATKKTMQSVSVQLVLPEGATILSADTSIDSDGLMHIERLEKRSTHTITAQAVFVKPVGTVVPIRAIVEYYGPFDTRLHELLTTTTSITSLPVTLEIDPPESVFSDTVATTSVRVHNTTTTTLKNLSLDLATDEAYRVISTDPATADSTLSWDIAELAPDASMTMQARGYIQTTSARNATTIATLSISFFQDTYTILETSETTRLTLVSASVEEEKQPTVSFAAAAHYYSDVGIQFGSGPLPPHVSQTTTYRIFWTITTPVALSNAVVTASLPPYSEWAANVSVADGSTITYDSSTRRLRWPIGDIQAGTASVSASFDISLTPGDHQVGTNPQLLSASALHANVVGSPYSWLSSALTTAIVDSQASVKSSVIR